MDAGSGQHGLQGPVCDMCRARKVKCDRGLPCANCRISQTICQSTKASPEKRQRILISNRYEQEISSVNKRLESLERILQNLFPSANRSTQDVPLSKVDTTRALLDQSLDGTCNDRRNTIFQGGSSFTTQSKHASDTFMTVATASLSSTSGREALTMIQPTVDNLLGGINGGAETKYHENSMLDPILRCLPKPPAGLVLDVLRYAKVTPQRFFRDHPFMSIAAFNDMCKSIYFPADQLTVGVFVIVNSGLCNLLRDLNSRVIAEQGLDSGQVANSITICEQNVDVAIGSLRLNLEPVLENIVALLLSASLRADSPNCFLSWRLISHAASLCQDAGYHRLPNDFTCSKIRQKRLVFWYTYAFDKIFSLNLGRCSTIQDYDISTARPRCPGDIDVSIGPMFLAWLDMAEVRGDIYRDLYSSRAQLENSDTKAQHAQVLVTKLWSVREKLSTKGDCDTHAQTISVADPYEAFDLIFYSILTLVYKTIPHSQKVHPLQYSDECLSTALTALRLYVKSWEAIDMTDGESWKLLNYWTLTLCPFIPFLVIFGSVVANKSSQDLEILERVVRTLGAAAQHSASVEKLHGVCSLFCQTAKTYLHGVGSAHQDTLDSMGNAQRHTNIGVDSIGLSRDNEATLSEHTWPDLDEWNFGLGFSDIRDVSLFLESHLAEHDGPFN